MQQNGLNIERLCDTFNRSQSAFMTNSDFGAIKCLNTFNFNDLHAENFYYLRVTLKAL